MSIDSIPRVLEGLDKRSLQIDNTQGTAATPSTGGGFGEILSKAMNTIDDMQQDVHNKIHGAVTGQKGIQPHDAMITLEKADLAFQLMNQVRSKIIRAYEDIMRTAV